jgi:hypothetical protein
MQSTLLRLAVALLAFGIGVSATMFWIAYRTPRVKRLRHTSCHMRPQMPLPPPPPVGELPPPPPAPSRSLVRISGFVLDDEVIRKPAPVYPPMAAETARTDGMALVEVEVMVGANGKVENAHAFSGDPLLWPAAEEAAYRAEFKPPRVQGEPAFMTGTLSYNFASRRRHGR